MVDLSLIEFIKALMEFHCNKDSSVAGKVFEVGMRTIDLAEDEDAAAYVSHYLDFLIIMNDDNSMYFLFDPMDFFSALVRIFNFN